MAQITITTTEEEKLKVMLAIKKCENYVVAVSTIAKYAKLNPNRVRYVISDLVDEKRIKRIPVKAFNQHYIRYKYEVI